MNRPLATLVAAVSALTVTACLGTSAEAAGNARIKVTGSILVHDDDGWFLEPNASEEKTTDVNQTLDLAPGQTRTASWTACAGNEVKTVYTLTAENLDNGRVRTQMQAVLYEGVSSATAGDTTSKCPTTVDLDGSANYPEQIIPAGGQVNPVFQVDNQDDGDDWGKFTVKIENQTQG